MTAKEHTRRYERCVEILSGEIDILTGVAALQMKVREAALNKRWADFEEMERAVEKASAGLAALEAERVKLCPGEESAASFYGFLRKFYGEEKDVLAGLYRQLKLLAARVRVENEALSRCAGEAHTVVSLFLEAAFPDRRGKIYGRYGSAMPPDMRSVLVNREF